MTNAPTNANPDTHALARWRERVGKSQAAVARELGVDRSRICAIEAGAGCSLRLAARIERLTDGEVPAIACAPSTAITGDAA